MSTPSRRLSFFARPHFLTTTALTCAGLMACAPEPRNERGFEVSDPAPAGAIESIMQPVRVCADGETVDGIDVSTYQGDIDWDAVAGSSVRYAIVRIGDGLGEDDHFEQNWAGARNAGLVRGAYQFFRTLRDPDAMADIVIRKVGRLGPGDLPVVLDLEGASIQDQPGNVVAANARRWLAAVEAGTGKRPVIYTGFYVWRDQVGNPDFSEHPLWIAAYVNHCPEIPDTWDRWTFWQTSDSGRIPGIAGNVDTDLFNGTLEDLQRMADGGGTPYGARFEAQSFPYAAMPAIELTVGETLEGWFDMRNTGTETWDENTRFAPTPRDQTGPLGPEGWLSETRISACPQATPPGEVCRFEVSLTGHAPGEVTQTFGMVQEGTAWFSDPAQGGPPDDQLAVKVNVSPAPVLPDGPTPPPSEDASVAAVDAGLGGSGGAGGGEANSGGEPGLGGGTPPDGPESVADAARSFADAFAVESDALPGTAPPTPSTGERDAALSGGCRAVPGAAGSASGGLALLLALGVYCRGRRRSQA